MTDQQKSEQAWVKHSKQYMDAADYLNGVEDFKSSLKRDIEKEIEENKNADQYEDYAKAYIAALEWVKNKIETVEP